MKSGAVRLNLVKGCLSNPLQFLCIARKYGKAQRERHGNNSNGNHSLQNSSLKLTVTPGLAAPSISRWFRRELEPAKRRESGRLGYDLLIRVARRIGTRQSRAHGIELRLCALYAEACTQPGHRGIVVRRAIQILRFHRRIRPHLGLRWKVERSRHYADDRIRLVLEPQRLAERRPRIAEMPFSQPRAHRSGVSLALIER